MLNKYFNNYSADNEQKLTSNLRKEAIQIKGHEYEYIPRSGVPDTLTKETNINTFDSVYTIEGYKKNVAGWGGDQDLISDFGLSINDTAEVIFHQERFREETNMDKPIEGDLIWCTVTKSLLEITFVEDEINFFNLGKNYEFLCRVEKFKYSHESVETGIPEIDDMLNNLQEVDGTLKDDNEYGQNEELENIADPISIFDPTNPLGNI